MNPSKTITLTSPTSGHIGAVGLFFHTVAPFTMVEMELTLVPLKKLLRSTYPCLSFRKPMANIRLSDEPILKSTSSHQRLAVHLCRRQGTVEGNCICHSEYAGPIQEAQSPLRRDEAQQLQLRDNRRQAQPHRPGRQPLVPGGRDCCFHALQICKCDGSDSGARAGGEGRKTNNLIYDCHKTQSDDSYIKTGVTKLQFTL